MNIKPFFMVAGLAMLCTVFGCKPQSSTVQEHHKNIVIVTATNFQAQVLSSTQPVVVDFWATWCMPCQAMMPVVAELATEYDGRVKFGKLDIDVEPDIARQYEVEAIPLLVIFKDGKPVDRLLGVKSKAELTLALEKVLSAGTATAP